jgi:hypothetical protein
MGWEQQRGYWRLFLSRRRRGEAVSPIVATAAVDIKSTAVCFALMPMTMGIAVRLPAGFRARTKPKRRVGWRRQGRPVRGVGKVVVLPVGVRIVVAVAPTGAKVTAEELHFAWRMDRIHDYDGASQFPC